jgi:hypothetical protein
VLPDILCTDSSPNAAVILIALTPTCALRKAYSDNMRPKTKFVTAVWGEAYIARFAALSLPSFLAQGNLPALAESTELEVLILTRSDNIGYFHKRLAFRRLSAICPVRFIEIDDLITSAVYGVTLTLAYTRAVIACGRDMLNTHFVFMNADFVLADGSLRSLCRHILAGRAIVLGPSFRATAEAVEPRLNGLVDRSSGVLTVEPRSMVRLALASPHATTTAKILNQGFCHSAQPNQFFWRVDEQTLLARYYLIFMLCLRPERVITNINSYCDYAFIPEMCPSGDEAVMGDSDDFFMLELQRRDQEMYLLRLGKQTDDEIAKSLQGWTTAEHRRAASHNVVFHVADIPPRIEIAKAEADNFVNRIARKLRRPLHHARHPFWVRGVAAWKNYRKEQGLTDSPPELAPLRSRLLDWISPQVLRKSVLYRLWSLLYTGRRMLQRLKLTPLHPYWADYRLLQQAILSAVSTPGARVLIVRDRPAIVDAFIRVDSPVHFISVHDMLNGRLSDFAQDARGYTHVLIYLLRKDCRKAQLLVKRCRQAMISGGVCEVFIHHLSGESEGSNFSHELTWYIDDILGRPSLAAECSFVGGRLKRFNSRWVSRLARHHARFGILSLPWVVPLLVLTIPVSLLVNLYLSFKLPSSRYVDHCSSVVVRFTS